MAGQSAKKRLEENRRRLTILRGLLLVGLACQIAIGYFAHKKGALSSKHITGLVLTSFVGWSCFFTISTNAAPIYDPNTGELLDGGNDLNKGGINGYAHDILYITAFVQIATLASSWFWYTYLTVPGYGLYKLTEKVIIPYFKGGSGGGDVKPDAATLKKLQRTEDRAQRRRMKNFR